MEEIIVKVEENEDGDRIDRFLATCLDGDYSRSFIQNLISKGNIRINDVPVKASLKVKNGTLIQIALPEPELLTVEAENIPLDIVYEDDDVVIVNKAQGMVVHPAAGHATGTLVNALMYHCKDALSTINGVTRPGIVHRIDKDTSGLLVICKNDNAHRCLSEQFAIHSITRKYTAICHGVFHETDGTVDKALARDKNDRKKIAISPDGRRAVTHYHVIERLKKDMTLVECQLETGRTHQIRVHMASIKHPILGDPVYGPKHCPFNLAGQTLHAGTLGFIHPSTKEYVEFQSELPDYYQRILRILSDDI